MIVVTGVLTKRSIGVPFDNIGLVRRMRKSEISGEKYKKYPQEFTRIYLKVICEGFTFVDCSETPKQIYKE